jgi:DNA-binding NarL/FixJ family response regulator
MPVLQDGWKVGTAPAATELVTDAGRERQARNGGIMPGQQEPDVWGRREVVPLTSDVAEVLRVTVQEETVRAIENVLQQERRRHPRQETLVFTDLERGILTGLGRGLKVQQISEQVALGERTVQRRIQELRARLGAERLGQLVTTAHELGFGKQEEE